MTIDVVSLTDAQFALLTREHIKEVRQAQQKKDALTAQYAEKKRVLKYKEVKAGNFRSAAYEKACNALEAECAAKIAAVREGLLFSLQYPERTETDASYADYALNSTERINAVKAYYNLNFTDAKARFDAFTKDKTAPVYLGEYYAGTYDYFYNAARAQ